MVKPSRGRPKDVEIELSQAQGRPPKVGPALTFDVQPTTSEVQPIKRKRGRPPNQRTHESQSTLTPAIITIQPVLVPNNGPQSKQKRGRPPTNPKPPTQQPTSSLQATTTRKRGRPRIHDPSTNPPGSPSQQPRRNVGRPPKNHKHKQWLASFFSFVF